MFGLLLAHKTHLEANSHRLQHILLHWLRFVCLWNRCHFCWSRQCNLQVSNCLTTPRHDLRLWMELNAGSCGPWQEKRNGLTEAKDRIRNHWMPAVVPCFWSHQQPHLHLLSSGEHQLSDKVYGCRFPTDMDLFCTETYRNTKAKAKLVRSSHVFCQEVNKKFREV